MFFIITENTRVYTTSCSKGLIKVHKNPSTEPLYRPLRSFFTRLNIICLYSNISFRNKANNNQSPKFFRKDSIDSNKYYSSYKDDNYSNIIDESTIKEFNQSIIRTNTEKHNDDFLSLDGDNDYSRTKEKEDNNENKYSFVNASFKAQSIKEWDTVNEEKSKENGKEYFGDKEFSLSLNYNNNPIFINEQNELSFNDVDNKN